MAKLRRRPSNGGTPSRAAAAEPVAYQQKVAANPRGYRDPDLCSISATHPPRPDRCRHYPRGSRLPYSTVAGHHAVGDQIATRTAPGRPGGPAATAAVNNFMVMPAASGAPGVRRQPLRPLSTQLQQRQAHRPGGSGHQPAHLGGRLRACWTTTTVSPARKRPAASRGRGQKKSEKVRHRNQQRPVRTSPLARSQPYQL